MFEPESTTVLWGISPMLFIVGGVYLIISIAAPHWLANSVSYIGLWNYCLRNGTCGDVTNRLNTTGGHSWYRAVQGLEIVATVLVLTGMVTGLVRVNCGQRVWQTACGVSAIMAGLLALAGVIIFGKNYQQIQDQNLSWAFVFNAVSSSMCLLAGPLLILDSLLHKI